MRIPPLLTAAVILSCLVPAAPAWAQPAVSVSVLDSPTVKLGYTSAPVHVSLGNFGNQDLVVTAVTRLAVNDFADFALDNNGHALPLTIPPNQTVDLLVRFTPTGVGFRSTELEVDSNDPFQPASMSFIGGTGVDVAIFTSGSINFGGVAVGQKFSSWLQWTNATDHDVRLESFSFVLGAASPFAVSAAVPPILVPAFSSVTFVEVDATPSVGFTVNDTLTFATDEPSEPTVTVALSVTGLVAAIDVAPRALELGYAAPGTTSAPQFVIISDTGQAQLDIASVTIVGPGASSFASVSSVPLGTPFFVPSYAPQPINIVYIPTERAAHAATLVITPSSPGLSPVSVRLSGTADLLDALPGEVDFPESDNAIVGQTDPHKQTVTLHAPVGSNVPVRISDIGVSRDFHVDWSKTTHNLISGGTTTFDVYFKPTAPGPLSGAGVIRTSDLGLILTIPLSGVGVPAPPTGCGCALGGQRPRASPWRLAAPALLTLGLGFWRRRRQATSATSSS